MVVNFPNVNAVTRYIHRRQIRNQSNQHDHRPHRSHNTIRKRFQTIAPVSLPIQFSTFFFCVSIVIVNKYNLIMPQLISNHLNDIWLFFVFVWVYLSYVWHFVHPHCARCECPRQMRHFGKKRDCYFEKFLNCFNSFGVDFLLNSELLLVAHE